MTPTDKCLKNLPCDVIKMREMGGEVDFYDVTWLIFETLCPTTRMTDGQSKFESIC